MNDKDIKEAYNFVFKTCYDTYAHSQEEKLKIIDLSWDDVGDKIKELERDIHATELADSIIRKNYLCTRDCIKSGSCGPPARPLVACY